MSTVLINNKELHLFGDFQAGKMVISKLRRKK